jgi:hypothetical protein
MVQASLGIGRAGAKIVIIEQRSNNGISHINIGYSRS